MDDSVYVTKYDVITAIRVLSDKMCDENVDVAAEQFISAIESISEAEEIEDLREKLKKARKQKKRWKRKYLKLKESLQTSCFREENQDNEDILNIGDEVIYEEDGQKEYLIVTYFPNNQPTVVCMTSDGTCNLYVESGLRRTGRYYQGFVEVINNLREKNNMVTD